MKNQNVNSIKQAEPSKRFEPYKLQVGQGQQCKTTLLETKDSKMDSPEMRENIWTDYNFLESKINHIKEIAEGLAVKLTPILRNDKCLSDSGKEDPEKSVPLSAALQRLTNLSFETQFILQDILDRLYL